MILVICMVVLLTHLLSIYSIWYGLTILALVGSAVLVVSSILALKQRKRDNDWAALYNTAEYGARGNNVS